MNVADVTEVPSDLSWERLFDIQDELSEKYQKIEGRTGLLNLDTKAGQIVVKDFLWRITEEVAEALDSSLGIDHVREEIIDGLHFLLELCIITDNDRFVLDNGVIDWLPTGYNRNNWKECVTALILAMGLVGRTCKNKPWKQTEIAIDQKAFRESMLFTWNQYMSICSILFPSPAALFDMYYRKSQVNLFRQRSNY
jgi:hypothetical protein